MSSAKYLPEKRKKNSIQLQMKSLQKYNGNLFFFHNFYDDY